MQFLAFAVLARLVDPAAFGVAAIVSIVTSFASLLADLGLGSALIQAPVLHKEDLGTASLINAALGVFLFTCCLLSRDLIAGVFGKPELALLLPVGALTFLLSLTVVHVAVLERTLQMRRLAVLEVAASALGLLAGCIAAAVGAGAIAVILIPVATAAAFSAFCWCSVGVPPMLCISGEAVRNLLKRGGGVALFNTANYWARNTDNLALARTVSAADLGFYSRAYAIMMLPIAQINLALNRVLVPTLSRLADDAVVARRTYFRATRLSALALFPATLGLAVVAKDFVPFVFGARWGPMAVLLSILAASGPAQVLSGPTGALYQGMRQTSLLARRGGVLSLLTVAAALIGLPWGAPGVCIAITVRFYVFLPYTLALPMRLVGATWPDLLREVASVASSATLMAVAVFMGRSFLYPTLGNGGALCVDLLLGPVAYVVSIAILDKRVLREAVGVVRRSEADPPLTSPCPTNTV